jgi:hypothetical protein
MAPSTLSDSSFSVCAVRQDLQTREQALRSEVKSEPDQARAARLADAANAMVRRRFRHQDSCETCWRIGSQGVQ